MNLRVDLIMPDERRSASVVNIKLLTRIGTIGGPAVLVALLVWGIMGYVHLGQQVSAAEGDLKDAEPKRAKAQKITQQAKVNNGILDELDGWKHGRMPWNDQLASLQEAVDPQIQLQSLRITQVLNLIDDKVAGRVFSLDLSGKAIGASTEVAVQALQRHFETAPAFTAVVDRVRIARFGQDPENKANRVFQLDGSFKPLLFK
jgi:hypothetical protein